MGHTHRPPTGPGIIPSAQTCPRSRARRGRAFGLALACPLLAGCLGSGGPLLSAQDPSLHPPLATLHTIASAGTSGDSIPARVIAARNLTAALVWAQGNDTIYHQAIRVDREWPLRLDAPLASIPPPEALLNVAENGQGRFGMALVFLFEDADGNGRFDLPKGSESDPAPAGGDWLMGIAGSARILYISDSAALAWVRAHPPEDEILTVIDPGGLRVGYNLLDGVNVRDTVFREYRILYPGGGTGLSPVPPDSGDYETLSHPGRVCDGFAPQDWRLEIQVSFPATLNLFETLVTVPRTGTARP